jgi:hypothetical protein
VLTCAAGKPFFSAVYSHGSTRMDTQELVDALVWIDTQFHIIRPMPDTMPTIEYILDKARAAVMRCVLSTACSAHSAQSSVLSL